MTIYRFNSPGEFARACTKIPKSFFPEDSSAKSWTGETSKESMDGVIYGNNKYVDEAEKILNKLYAEIDIPYPTWQSSMQGAYPMVPDYLMGEPESMKKLEEEDNTRNPITIYYVTSSSAGHSWENLLKKGIAALALGMVLSKTRPINFKLVATLDGKSSDKCSLIEINVNLNDLSLATAAYAIASTGFDRNLTHTYATFHNGFSGHWAWFSYPDSDTYWYNLRKALDIKNDDILIKGAFLTDELIVKDPILWCKQEIEKFMLKSHLENNDTPITKQKNKFK